MKNNRPGVYYIKCTATGRGYVGASLDMEKRIKHHFYEMRNGWKGIMGEDYKKYGPESFTYEVVEYLNPGDLAEEERFWSGRLNTEYNIEAPKNNRFWKD